MVHEDYREMLAAHALDALDREEARALAAHLSDCPECRAELEAWRETSAMLAYSVEVAEPSANLRERILAGARAHRQDTDSLERPSGSPGDGQRVGESSETSASNVVPFAPPPRPSWPRAFLFGAIAASLIFVTLAASLFVLWRRNNALRAELAGLSQRLNETQQELAVVREENMMLASPDTRTALLAGTQMAPQARARLTIDKQTGRAMLSVYNLPPAPEGKAYQLWFIADGRVMPGKVFKPDAQGSVLMHEEVPAAARLTAVFAVTLEPQGGVQSPTGEKYLLGSSAALQGA